MIRVFVKITGGPEDKKRELTHAVNLGMAVAIEKDYHERFLARHFRKSATGRYGYEKRTKRYTLRKMKAKGHERPMVWSGTMRRQLMGRITIKALKTKSEASGKMYGRALNFSRQAGYPDMKREIQAVAPDEREQMAVTTTRVATRKLNSIRTERTRELR